MPRFTVIYGDYHMIRQNFARNFILFFIFLYTFDNLLFLK